METWNLLISKRMRPKRFSSNKLMMVGAEGFEVSFPSGHYTVFFVEIKGKPNQNQKLPNFSGVSFFPYSLTRGPHSARNWYHRYHPSFEGSVQSPWRRCHRYNVMGLAMVFKSQSGIKVRPFVKSGSQFQQ